MRSRIKKLERASKHISDMEEAKAVFLRHMDRLRALTNGEPLPPPHPKASGPKYQGTCYSDIADIRDDVGPVEDLSE